MKKLLALTTALMLGLVTIGCGPPNDGLGAGGGKVEGGPNPNKMGPNTSGPPGAGSSPGAPDKADEKGEKGGN